MKISYRTTYPGVSVVMPVVPDTNRNFATIHSRERENLILQVGTSPGYEIEMSIKEFKDVYNFLKDGGVTF